MTEGQRRAYVEHWEQWGLDYDHELLDVDAAFGRDGPLHLEIGFGMGQSLLTMAQAAPQTNFIGVEVHKPGVGRLLHDMAASGTDNIRVYCHDAVEVLRHCIADNGLDRLQIFFPDPWHKKRHHKRRLIQAPFIAKATDKLRPGGRLHLATDWQPYAEQMMDVIEAEPRLRNLYGPGVFSPRPESRPETKFEARGERLGHGVWDLLHEKR